MSFARRWSRVERGAIVCFLWVRGNSTREPVSGRNDRNSRLMSWDRPDAGKRRVRRSKRGACEKTRDARSAAIGRSPNRTSFVHIPSFPRLKTAPTDANRWWSRFPLQKQTVMRRDPVSSFTQGTRCGGWTGKRGSEPKFLGHCFGKSLKGILRLQPEVTRD